MTKVYNGNGEYTVHLLSGRELILSEEEINDLLDDHPVVTDLRDERDGEKEAGDALYTALDTMRDMIIELKDTKINNYVSDVELKLWLCEELEAIDEIASEQL